MAKYPTPAIICSFSGSVAYLKPKEKRNRMLVLKALSNDPRVSTWDMGENKLYVTVYDLVEKGFVVDRSDTVGYPWHRFEITNAGRKALLEG